MNLAHSIRLETEQEEKRLLQDQLRQLEISSNEINNKLFKQIDQVRNISLNNLQSYLRDFSSKKNLMKNKILVYNYNVITKNVFMISCKSNISPSSPLLFLLFFSTENNTFKTTNELQIDVLKSDIKRLQEELQTITKVFFSFSFSHFRNLFLQTKDDEITKHQKRVNELQVNIDQLESQVCSLDD